MVIDVVVRGVAVVDVVEVDVDPGCIVVLVDLLLGSFARLTDPVIEARNCFLSLQSLVTAVGTTSSLVTAVHNLKGLVNEVRIWNPSVD